MRPSKLLSTMTSCALCLVILLAASGGCGSDPSPATDESSNLGTSRSALSAAGLRPVPYLNPTEAEEGKQIWFGSGVELLLADALASCTKTWHLYDYEYQHPREDEAWSDVTHEMERTAVDCLGAIEGAAPEWYILLWPFVREDPKCNRDPLSLSAKAYEIESQPAEGFSLPDRFALGLDEQTHLYFSSDVIRPMYDLCVASKLRQVAPGAAGAEALLMSEREQRELLAVMLNRTERSMLGFATLGITMAYGEETRTTEPLDEVDPAVVPDIRRLRAIHLWANWGGPGLEERKGTARTLGRDFAAAIELHSVLAKEMTELLTRSASARADRGSSNVSLAEEIWGPGSWRQRAMSSLYGGYFLAVENDNVPWADLDDPDRRTSPSLYDEPWPAHDRSPFPRYEIRGPEAALFGNLTKLLPFVELVTFDPSPLVGLECRYVNRPQSGALLYQAVERELRRNAGICDTWAPDPADPCKKICTVTPPLPPLQDGFEDYQLWTQHRLKPEHAEAYAAYIANFLEPICSDTGVSAPSGMVNIAGRLGNTPGGGMIAPNRVYIGSDAILVPKTLEQRAGAYTRFMPWRMPSEISMNVPAWQQGFPRYELDPEDNAFPTSYRAMGHMGTISAQVALRDGLHAMEAAARAPHIQPYAPLPGPSVLYSEFRAHLRSALALINATVGEKSMSIRPKISYPVHEHVAMVEGAVLPIESISQWEGEITVPSEDDWWAEDTEQIELFVVANDPWAGSLAMNPMSKIFGRTIKDVIPDSLPGEPFEDITGTLEAQTGVRRLRSQFTVRSVNAIPFPINNDEATMIARKGLDSYRLLGERIRVLTPHHPDQGQYFASGGNLGVMAQRLLMPQNHNPVLPMYDGFGLPTQWIPPSDPRLFGGTQGESGLSHYLSTAEEMSHESAVATQAAIEGLIEQQVDEAEREAAEKRNAKVNEAEVASLCGGNPNCGAELATERVPMLTWNDEWLQPKTGGSVYPLEQICSFDADSGEIERFEHAVESCGLMDLNECATNSPDPVLKFVVSFQAGIGGEELAPEIEPDALAAVASLYCDSMRLLGRFGGMGGVGDAANVEVAAAVKDHLGQSVQPSFSEYAGGSLQSVLIEQWAALRSFEALADELAKSTDAATIHVLHANAIAKSASQTYHRTCNPLAEQLALVSCFTMSCGFPSGCSVSFNPGPLLSYQQNCKQLALSVGPTLVAAQAAEADAVAQIASYGQRIAEAAKQVQLSSATMHQQVQRAKSAVALNDLENELVQQNQVTSFGLYRRYHSYDLWRAKALLESARRYGVAARRTVEARFAVDMGAMHADEPFVTAPSAWSDEIYSYDLSLPAAVGLSVGVADPSGIYANKVYDYIGNLKRFVDGFAVHRPSSAAEQDSEIISLPGPCSKRQVWDEQGQVTVWLPSEGATAWKVFCPNTQQWLSPSTVVPVLVTPEYESGAEVPVPQCGNDSHITYSLECVANPCGEGDQPTRARFEFNLDPWGRLNDVIAHEPYVHRYNGRWIKLAVNLVGGDILDCTTASDIAQCMSDRVVRYNLVHTGPSWVNTYEQGWHLLGAPTAYVEGGKAIAHNEWLSPLLSSWSHPHVEAAARTEFTERPLAGTYALELQLDPEVHLERVERIQVLAATTYWVGQD